jgi:hypothetical protein
MTSSIRKRLVLKKYGVSLFLAASSACPQERKISEAEPLFPVHDAESSPFSSVKESTVAGIISKPSLGDRPSPSPYTAP